MTERLLMIFVKNPELGKVKTRLARTLGEEKALQVYRFLLDHTREVAREVGVDRAVFYSSFADENDSWGEEFFQKYVQEGDDLGERMENAFAKAFAMGYKSVVIIGSDCLELSSQHLNDAFAALIDHDTVVGPARDGGYYLLGMNKIHPEFFLDKQWSTDSVLPNTLRNILELKLSHVLLAELSDVDFEEDLALSEVLE
ncbi:MAG: TIGR04282 family arsenosugar biosynthesis glycosyltransferase [Bacteroidia bacterium]|nr:TIGR04282 family arsenosugar biosynthesis glycosyltransferase [Bacteroidia bacterium]